MTAGPPQRRETVTIAAGRPERVPGLPLDEPITLASALHADGSTAYARDGLRSWAALEAAVGALDGGHAVALSSGLAACAAVLAQVHCRNGQARAVHAPLPRDRDARGTGASEPSTALRANHERQDGGHCMHGLTFLVPANPHPTNLCLACPLEGRRGPCANQ